MEDEQLLAEIRSAHRLGLQTYGSSRLHEVLILGGRRVGRRRIERLMRGIGRRGCSTEQCRRTPGLDRFLGVIGNEVRKVTITGTNQVCRA